MMIGFEDQLWIALDVLIACILGGVIGFERESKNKPAGLRTHMLIAGSAALIVTLGVHVT
ncbi:MAG: MgtC/SapB family protein, partial [Flavobacteriales bacterium]|nr:MgtC/SapB family protein [Flavobacteriales bacterium]